MKSLKLAILTSVILLTFPLNVCSVTLGKTQLKEGEYKGTFSYKEEGKNKTGNVKVVVSEKAILGHIFLNKLGSLPLFFSHSKEAKLKLENVKVRFSATSDSSLKFTFVVKGKMLGRGTANHVQKGVTSPSKFSGTYVLEEEKTPILNIASDGSAIIVAISFQVIVIRGTINETGNFILSPDTEGEVKLTKIDEELYELQIIEPGDEVEDAEKTILKKI